VTFPSEIELALSKPDNRFTVRNHDAVETEALGQGEIICIVREHLDSIPLEVVRRREDEQRKAIAEFLRKLGEQP
jgi:hypothetical protein